MQQVAQYKVNQEKNSISIVLIRDTILYDLSKLSNKNKVCVAKFITDQLNRIVRLKKITNHYSFFRLSCVTFIVDLSEESKTLTFLVKEETHG